ncbi:MAG: RNB domain-containing ribonuclease, partial [Bryocella sp.]
MAENDRRSQQGHSSQQQASQTHGNHGDPQQQNHQHGHPGWHSQYAGHAPQERPTFVHEHQDPKHFDLAGAALDEMHEAGFRPEFGADVQAQVDQIVARLENLQPAPGVEDLRALGWSAIDNDTSRDLDQIEVAERVATGIKMRVAIGDVADAVALGSPIDKHAQAQTQTIYTAVRNFPMLPLELSTGVTSLNENGDRNAVMMSFTVSADGHIVEEGVSRAVVRNRAQLAYSRVGPWLEDAAKGSAVSDVMELRSDSAREHDEAQLDSGTLP